MSKCYSGHDGQPMSERPDVVRGTSYCAGCAWSSIQERAFSDEHGLFRWESNGRLVPFEIVFAAGVYGGSELELHREHLRAEASAAVQQYIERRERSGYSAEERYEMRAAFGDEEVVDIFTGKRVQ